MRSEKWKRKSQREKYRCRHHRHLSSVLELKSRYIDVCQPSRNIWRESRELEHGSMEARPSGNRARTDRQMHQAAQLRGNSSVRPSVCRSLRLSFIVGGWLVGSDSGLPYILTSLTSPHLTSPDACLTLLHHRRPHLSFQPTLQFRRRFRNDVALDSGHPSTGHPADVRAQGV